MKFRSNKIFVKVAYSLLLCISFSIAYADFFFIVRLLPNIFRIYVYNVHKYITVGEILVKSIQERELCCFEMEEIKESADGLHEPVSINGKLGIPFPRYAFLSRWLHNFVLLEYKSC